MQRSVIDHPKPYTNGSKRCNLSWTEKYQILISLLNLINKRSELASKRRLENMFYFGNYKAIPQEKSQN